MLHRNLQYFDYNIFCFRKNIQLVSSVQLEQLAVMFGDVPSNRCYFLREYKLFNVKKINNNFCVFFLGCLQVQMRQLYQVGDFSLGVLSLNIRDVLKKKSLKIVVHHHEKNLVLRVRRVYDAKHLVYLLPLLLLFNRI